MLVCARVPERFAVWADAEQVRGAPVDHRSDLFSFGVILHELLSGKRAFHGETSVDTMQAILRQDAPELAETVPAGVRQIERLACIPL